MGKGRRDQEVYPARWPRSGRLMVTPTAVYYIYCCYRIFLNEPHDFTHLGDPVTLIQLPSHGSRECVVRRPGSRPVA